MFECRQTRQLLGLFIPYYSYNYDWYAIKIKFLRKIEMYRRIGKCCTQSRNEGWEI